MWWLVLTSQMLLADAKLDPVAPPPEPPASEVVSKMQVTRASISEVERRQREALSHLFLINQRVKEIAHKQEVLNQHALAFEADIRTVAQDVGELENRTQSQKDMLNKRLRQLYQERGHDDFHWLFSARSPVELERNHRFLKRMIDSDHRQLKLYLTNLNELNKKHAKLKVMVEHYAGLGREVRRQEQALDVQLREKSKLLEDLKRSKDVQLSQLKGLRQQNGQLSDLLSYAFFERKGILHPPIDGRLKREYGTYVDPQLRFRLTHKGLFYEAAKNSAIRSVFHGKVVFASNLPGYGKTVIVDHGDSYYSVYAFASQLKVRNGQSVQEGDLVALSGEKSPLFGPGLYFEIRHFTDAIDPRPWIKDSVIKTADMGGNEE